MLTQNIAVVTKPCKSIFCQWLCERTEYVAQLWNWENHL